MSGVPPPEPAQPGSIPPAASLPDQGGADVHELERIAVRAARAAGDLISGQRPQRVEATATKSSPTDVVTAMDVAAQRLLRDMLLAARPRDAFLGEEGDDLTGTSGVVWVVDPIDGTVNYLYDLAAYSVSVAAVVGDPRTPGRWRVLAGAVADPSLRRIFRASVGGGAWEAAWEAPEHGRRLAVRDGQDLAQALVGTGFGYQAQVRSEQAALLRRVLPSIRDIRRMGSAALDLCAVASGRLDGYYEIGLNPWDMAAGWLLVVEAGGVVSGPVGGPPSAVLTVAANRALHGPLSALLASM